MHHGICSRLVRCELTYDARAEAVLAFRCEYWHFVAISAARPKVGVSRTN